MSKIYVSLQVGQYPSSDDSEVVLPISENFIYEAMEPLDHPDPKAPPMACMPCTSRMKIQYVAMERERIAKMLSAVITQALLEMMAADDTLMGYKKARTT